MSWTYDTSLLTATSTTGSLMKVRRMIGDTDTNWQLLQDEEIYFVLATESSPALAAAVTCELIAAGFLRQCNTENGQLRVSAAARHKHYLDMADRLRRGGAGDLPGDITVINADMYVGGAEVAANEALRDNDTREKPHFTIGEHDNPEYQGGSLEGWIDNVVD